MAIRKGESLSFAQEISSIHSDLVQPETEESWDTIAQAITRVCKLCKTSTGDSLEIISSIYTFSRPLNSAMSSERTRLSGAAVELVSVLASTLGASFDSLLPAFLPTLLVLCGRPNKVFIARARTCILTIIEMTLLPSILPYLVQSLREKSVSLRLTALESVLACLNCFNPPDLEKESRAQDIENAIRVTARDANAEVRKVSRKVFEAYQVLLPNRVDKFTAPLTPTMKRYLDVAAKRSSPVQAGLLSRPHTSQGHHSTRHFPQSNPLSSSTSASHPTGNNLARSRTQSASHTVSAMRLVKPAEGERGKNRTPASDSIPLDSVQSGPSKSMPAPQSCVLTRPAITNQTGIAQRLPRLPGPSKPGATDHPHRARMSSARDNTIVRGEGDSKRTDAARRIPLVISASKDDPEQTNQLRRSTSRKGISTTDATSKASNPACVVATANASRDVPRAVPGLIRKRSARDLSCSSSVNAPPSGANTRVGGQGGSKQTGTVKTLVSQDATRKAPKSQKKVETAKPLWGRSALPKAIKAKPMSKGGSTSVGGHVASLSVNNKPSKTVPQRGLPQQVPLPPSPVLTPSDPVETDEVNVPEALEQVAVACVAGEMAEDIMKELIPPAAENSSPMAAQDALVICADFQRTPSHSLLADLPSDSSHRTPISSLLSSIQNGFLFTPTGPLSPPQSYLFAYSNSNEMADEFGGQKGVQAGSMDERPVSQYPFRFGIAKEGDRPVLSE